MYKIMIDDKPYLEQLKKFSVSGDGMLAALVMHTNQIIIYKVSRSIDLYMMMFLDVDIWRHEQLKQLAICVREEVYQGWKKIQTYWTVQRCNWPIHFQEQKQLAIWRWPIFNVRCQHQRNIHLWWNWQERSTKTIDSKCWPHDLYNDPWGHWLQHEWVDRFRYKKQQQ